ncbi:hypothetical protein ZOSMA_1G01220 [Zostera marina]|uniref:Uncharacterized protein n=1 Tax=Zostera marina TaxID=29655 RepID=A0A0K9PMH8_ZOSMR|nr:hypothetical protein ZOSMA_1G01220 [Zostera marina]
MAISTVGVAKAVFSLLGCSMLVFLIYTIITDGSPFRSEIFTPWLVATVIDFYINVIAISVWVAHKEYSVIGAIIWIVLLICLGSVTTCTYVVLQLCNISSRDPAQYLMYNVLVQHGAENDTTERKCPCIVIGRIAFGILGCIMLATLVYTLSIDGLPFRKELATPWMVVTLIDFYINVSVISTWVSYKETNWLSALIWIVFFICLGSLTTCVYIVIQLFKLSSEDPLYHVYAESPRKQVRRTSSSS